MRLSSLEFQTLGSERSFFSTAVQSVRHPHTHHTHTQTHTLTSLPLIKWCFTSQLNQSSPYELLPGNHTCWLAHMQMRITGALQKYISSRNRNYFSDLSTFERCLRDIMKHLHTGTSKCICGSLSYMTRMNKVYCSLSQLPKIQLSGCSWVPLKPTHLPWLHPAKCKPRLEWMWRGETDRDRGHDRFDSVYG